MPGFTPHCKDPQLKASGPRLVEPKAPSDGSLKLEIHANVPGRAGSQSGRLGAW
jgi:hypothetical protein